MSRLPKFVIPGIIGLAALGGLEVVLFGALGPLRALFLQIAALGLIMAAATVLARNLVHAALSLVAFNFVVACLYVLLEAEFLAAVQVLVYIGAVAILLMFGIMLTRDIQGDETTRTGWSTRLPAGVVALALLAMLLYGIAHERGRPGRPAWSQTLARAPLDTPERAAAVESMAQVLGVELMTRWLVPFEVAGLFLTAALIGAVALAMSEPDAEPEAEAEALRPVRAGAAAPPKPRPTPAAVPASASEPR